ncbi:transcription factor TFIIB [Halorubrum distributum]|nr:transcription factor TFIIB [Halorubrum distributum]
MSRTNASEKTVSDAQLPSPAERGHTPTVEHAPSTRTVCPECESQVITNDETSFCTGCGLVVADEWVDRSPTLTDLGMVGDADQSIETVDPLRTDKGLHTKIGKSTDGHGNPLSNAQWERTQRLRKWHNRMQFSSERSQTKRLNEGLRDVEMIGANLSLPDHVTKQAARYLRRGSEARLPGGRMAWESLAGGAVLLAVRGAAVDRDPVDVAVATHAKAPRERVCAAARKLRCECALDVPVTRPDAVLAVLEGLDDAVLPGARAVRTWRLARHLLALADRVPVGPGTSRGTVAAAALYAADRLLDGSYLTQPQVVAATESVVATSRDRVGRYSRELRDAYEAAHGTADPGVGLEAEWDTQR